STYSIVKNIPITFLPYSDIEKILKPHDKTPKKVIPTRPPKPLDMNDDMFDELMSSISMEEILEELGIDTSKNPTECFAHGSNGGKCFGFTSEAAHCFHCDGSWNKFSLIKDAKNLDAKQTFDWFAEKTGKTDELQESRDNYVKELAMKKAVKVFTIDGQAEIFYDEQPYFYDKSKMFWLWDKEDFKWVLSDEVDILNTIYKVTGKDIITSKSRTEILNSLKQKGRLNHPLPIEKSWIQFKDKIYDVKTGACFAATPAYFATNPIPWEVGESEATPT
ncbi:unnamed protein product, partial [marine sediment metagenome]